MQEHAVDEEAALRLLREVIREKYEAYRVNVKGVAERVDLSRDLKVFLEALMYSLSANVVWSRSCPRYNEGREFNEVQLRWMREGTPRTPGILGPEIEIGKGNTEWRGLVYVLGFLGVVVTFLTGYYRVFFQWM